jgi:hypothetical protein
MVIWNPVLLLCVENGNYCDPGMPDPLRADETQPKTLFGSARSHGPLIKAPLTRDPSLLSNQTSSRAN